MGGLRGWRCLGSQSRTCASEVPWSEDCISASLCLCPTSFLCVGYPCVWYLYASISHPHPCPCAHAWCVCVCVAQRLTSGALSYFYETRLSLNPELNVLAGPASQPASPQDPPVHILHEPGLHTCSAVSGCYLNAWHPNAGPQAHIA